MKGYSYLLIMSVLGVVGTSNASELLSNWGKSKTYADRLMMYPSELERTPSEREDRAVSLQVAREDKEKVSRQERDSVWIKLEPFEAVREQRTNERRRHITEKACACVLAAGCLGVFIWIIVTNRVRA